MWRINVFIKTVATRCLDFSSKHLKMCLAARLRPDPLGELKRSPRPPSRKRGPTSKGRGGEGREGEDGREGKGREKGGEGTDFAGPIKIWLLRPWSVVLFFVCPSQKWSDLFQAKTIVFQLPGGYARCASHCRCFINIRNASMRFV